MVSVFKFFDLFLTVHGCKYTHKELVDYVCYLFETGEIGVPEREAMLIKVQIHMKSRMSDDKRRSRSSEKTLNYVRNLRGSNNE